MARTKPTSSSAEQSSKTGAGGELHQQPPDGGALLTTNPQQDQWNQLRFSNIDLPGTLCISIACASCENPYNPSLWPQTRL